jgi:hypothetical protein
MASIGSSRARLWLRVTSGLFAFFTFGHTMGMLNTTSRGPAEDALLATMRAVRFPIMGVTRSHWDFYQGFGFTVTILQALMAVLCWQLGSLSATNPAQARPLVLTLLAASAGIAAMSWIYFFAAPAAFATATVLLLALAVWELSS